MTMTGEQDGRAETTAAINATGGAPAEALTTAESGAQAASAMAATEPTETTAPAEATEAAAPTTANAPVAAASAPVTALATTRGVAAETTPEVASPPDNARVRDSLEAIKTAVVWLIVVNILTVLSPLLRLSIKWTLIVGFALTLACVVVGCAAYLKARATQRLFPE